MNKYEAQGYISEVRELLHKAANATSPLAQADEKRLLALESTAEGLLAGDLSNFAITTAREGAALAPTVADGEDASAPGPYDDVRLEAVVEVAAQPTSKVLELPTGLHRLDYVRYVAYSAEQTLANGRVVRDSCASGAEGFVLTSGKPKPFGAASALVARLLEPLAAGVWPLT